MKSQPKGPLLMMHTGRLLFPSLCVCALSCSANRDDVGPGPAQYANIGGAGQPVGGSGPSAGAAGAAGGPVRVENGGGQSGGPPINPPVGGSGAAGFMNMGNGGGIMAGSGGFAPAAGGMNAGAGGFNLGTGGMSMGAGGMINPGTGGMNAGTGGTVVGGNSGTCTFTFDVTTVTARGRYSPRNAGAIWISDAQNKFVKTLRTWSYIEMAQVTAWVQASGNNRVDAVTGATRSGHGPVPSTTWNCTDVQKKAVPDGQYTVHVTFAESDANPFAPGPGIQAAVNFTKSPAGADVMGQDTANFTMMHVKLTIP
jgi:hypothetical protein